MLTRSRVLTIALATGCAGKAPRPLAAQPCRLLEHPGVWVSHGYGYVIEVTPDRLRLFHVAGETCVEEPPADTWILSFFDLHRASGRTELWLSGELDPYEYHFTRVPELPVACREPAANTPTGNFEAFAAFFAHHYAFFDLYGVNWAAEVAKVRPHVTPDTSDEHLYQLIVGLLAPLRDAHVQVEAVVGGQARVYDGNPGKTEIAIGEWGDQLGLSRKDALRRFRSEHWFGGVRDRVLAGRGVMAANGRLQYGIAGDGVGYLAVVSMGGFVDGEESSAKAELPVLDQALDEAFAHFAARGADRLILDVSLNTGGYDFVALAIASRFVGERTLAYWRRAGDDPEARAAPIYLEPHGRRFTGPVYVLTSDLTVSAGEVLVLALRGLPNVTVVGEATRGAFSTVLNKILPNGWVLSLSNEVYVDRQGSSWEGRGLPPDRVRSLFSPEMPTTRHAETVIALARELVRR